MMGNSTLDRSTGTFSYVKILSFFRPENRPNLQRMNICSSELRNQKSYVNPGIKLFIIPSLFSTLAQSRWISFYFFTIIAQTPNFKTYLKIKKTFNFSEVKSEVIFSQPEKLRIIGSNWTFQKLRSTDETQRSKIYIAMQMLSKNEWKKKLQHMNVTVTSYRPDENWNGNDDALWARKINYVSIVIFNNGDPLYHCSQHTMYLSVLCFSLIATGF